MRNHHRSSGRALRRVVPALVLAPALLAWTSVRAGLTLQPQSRLWVEGTSTVRGFECKAASFDAQIESTSPGAVAAVLAGEKAVRGVDIKVPVEQLDCGNGTMNDHMRKALKATEHPVIAFHLASYELAKGSEGMQAKLNGKLSLGGVENEITINADAKEDADGTLRVAGTHEIRMKEYGLKPPTLMLGTMKVNERVKVRFDLLLKE